MRAPIRPPRGRGVAVRTFFNALHLEIHGDDLRQAEPSTPGLAGLHSRRPRSKEVEATCGLGDVRGDTLRR